MALVGESGAGKSTTSYLVLRLVEADAGSITLSGTDVRALDRRALRRFRSKMQIVFQDPHSSLDPRVPVGRSVAEPLRVLTGMNRAEREASGRADDGPDGAAPGRSPSASRTSCRVASCSASQSPEPSRSTPS